MKTQEFGKIKYMSKCSPPLYTGEYTVSLEQEILEPTSKTMPTSSTTFFVETPQFTIPPSLIYNTFPANGSSGNYENTLPHILFNDKTFPWRRRFTESDEDTPWLALVCFCENELPQLKQMTIQELISSKDTDVFCPSYEFHHRTSEKDTDKVLVMDVPMKMVTDIFPRAEELAYLSHVRVTDMYDKNDELIQLDGYFSTVMCNRFPVSSEAGVWNTAALLSVEGYKEILPSIKNTSLETEYRYVRFVVLHSFKFFSCCLDYLGFRGTMETLDSNVLYLRNSNTDESDQDVNNLFKKGYVPLEHLTRSGEKTVSIYRGAFVPYEVEDKKLMECLTADAEILYDPLVGIFDMSYSAAWQLGRLMALKNKSIAKLIFEWRRAVMKKAFLNIAKQNMKTCISPLFQDANIQTELLDQDDFRADVAFLQFFALHIGPALTMGKITPIADDTGLGKQKEEL